MQHQQPPACAMPCLLYYQTPSKLPPCMAWFTWTLWAPPRARDRLSGTGSNVRRGVTLRSPQAPAGSRKRPPMDGSMRTWTRCQIRGKRSCTGTASVELDYLTCKSWLSDLEATPAVIGSNHGALAVPPPDGTSASLSCTRPADRRRPS
jgi:hypothetical protein